MDLQEFLKALTRRWPTAVTCLVLSVATALAVTSLSTPAYEARTQLFVATHTGEDTVDLNGGQTFSQARVQSYAEIVKSRHVTAPVVKQLRLHTTPEELASRITAIVPLKTVLIDITVQDSVPRRAARIANAVAEQFSSVVEGLETPKRPTPSSPHQTEHQGGPAAPASPVSLGVTQEAVTPTSPASPRPWLNLAVGTVGGLLLAAGLVALRETLDTTFKTSEALNTFTALPGLGTIPYDRNAPRQLIASAHAHSRRAEAFRKLRTNLQFSQVDDPPRVIIVTSSVLGEGKTNTAINLALSLAEAGVSTCLVDGDLRHPSVADAFGLVQNAGLTTVLTGQARTEDVMQQVTDGLSVLTSGAVPPNPAELLSSARAEGVLRELADTYKVVIVDTAPLLPVADTLGLARLRPGALLVVKATKTTRDQVHSATDSLKRVGAQMLGTVFSMAPVSRSGRCGRYGEYGRYGYLPAPRTFAGPQEGAASAVTRLADGK
ncbi:polysaccharide biosynthesis tyrosine autokinase [Streptomyces sp. NPDC086787]|uniref:polysaccharide biosynthesis tyrosine autokinase n=1 Tax=Streptomyces sp. NPDC086787 TaxID=3365759 RepID=UPI003800A64E